MKNMALSLMLASLVAAGPLCLPGAARADAAVQVNQIDVTYHGGALIQHASVDTLFWGKEWSGTPPPDYFNGFFKALFADGRYMANLSQYSRGGFKIGGGKLAVTDTDEVEPPARVTDAQIQAEIRAQVAAGKLPAADADTLYFVFTPPNVVVVNGQGQDSENDFAGYHDFAPDGQFAYAVIPFQTMDGGEQLMTLAASHELAEAVTDPEPVLQETVQGGWYDEQYGEIGDIPASLFSAQQIGVHDFVDVLTGRDGTRYLVQKEWSVKDGKPVAFAADTGGQPKPGFGSPDGGTPAVIGSSSLVRTLRASGDGALTVR